MITTQQPENVTKPAPLPEVEEKRTAAFDVAKLSRAWRSLVSKIVVTTRTAEKAAMGVNMKEFEETVDQTVRARQDFRRCIATLDSQLLGQAKETEALLGMLQSQPRLGQKRKREDTDTDRNR